MAWDVQDTMRLGSLRLRNFRRFSDFSIDFDPKMTVIVGDNGSGKTALLDAAAVALGATLTKIDGASRRNITLEDVRQESESHGSRYVSVEHYPVEISAVGTAEGVSCDWQRAKKSHNGRTSDTGGMTVYAEHWNEVGRHGKTADTAMLPLIAYYGSDRLHGGKRLRQDPQWMKRFAGYWECLDTKINLTEFTEWMKQISWSEYEDRSEGETTVAPELTVIKEAARQCLKGLTGRGDTDVFYSPKQQQVIVRYSNETGGIVQLPFSWMSSGYVSVLGIVMDIAHRMVNLNIDTTREPLNVLCTPGVVLIDEVDLHLHPKWQERVLEDLQHVFPNIQFIVTTHAPVVVASVKQREQLRMLREGDNGRLHVDMPGSEVYGQTSARILEQVMGANDVRADVKTTIEEIDDALDDDEFDDARSKLRQLLEVVGPENAEYERLHTALEFMTPLEAGESDGASEDAPEDAEESDDTGDGVDDAVR